VEVELRELEALVAVAQERSFTGAGRRLHLSQQSVSAVVRRLEVKLGVTLFERTTRRVEPTPACEALLPPVEEALGLLNRAFARMQEGGSRERVLRVAFTPAAGLGSLQELLGAAAEMGLPEPEVRELWADELADGLRDGRFDAAIGVEVRSIPGFDVVPWRRERVDLLVAIDHPFARRRHVEVAQLCGTTVVLPDPKASPALRDKLLATFSRAGVEPSIEQAPRISRTAPTAVERGTAVTVWLTGMDDRHVPDGFVHVHLTEPETFVTIDFVASSAPGASPTVSLERLREAVERTKRL
jgi:LysR family transcriptional regulator, benzoate and cis,cis-muconate-responsive activator of ben and cat genes